MPIEISLVELAKQFKQDIKICRKCNCRLDIKARSCRKKHCKAGFKELRLKKKLN